MSRVISRKSYDLTRLFAEPRPACASLTGDSAGQIIAKWVGDAPSAKASVSATLFEDEWTARTAHTVSVPTAIIDAVAEVAQCTSSSRKVPTTREFTVTAFGPSPAEDDLRIVQIPPGEMGKVTRRNIFVVSTTKTNATETFTLSVGQLASHDFLIQSAGGRAVSLKGLETSVGTTLTFGGSKVHETPPRKGGYRAQTQKLTPSRRCVVVIDEIGNALDSSRIAEMMASLGVDPSALPAAISRSR